jgi:hypothetical protein
MSGRKPSRPCESAGKPAHSHDAWRLCCCRLKMPMGADVLEKEKHRTSRECAGTFRFSARGPLVGSATDVPGQDTSGKLEPAKEPWGARRMNEGTLGYLMVCLDDRPAGCRQRAADPLMPGSLHATQRVSFVASPHVGSYKQRSQPLSPTPPLPQRYPAGTSFCLWRG